MNRDVLIDFVDKKVCGFDIIVIVIIYVRFVLCVRVFVCAFTGGKWSILEDKMEEKSHILNNTQRTLKREDVVESFATRFAARRRGSGRRVCCQCCEDEVFFIFF